MMPRSVPEHVKRWNDTARPYPRHATLPQLFARQVDRFPAAPALTAGGTTLSYRELADRATGFAHLLRRDHGVSDGDLVGLLLERSVASVVALWAVLHAGGVYVPLDPDQPDARLQEMVDRIGIGHVATLDRWRDRLTGPSVLLMDETPSPAPATRRTSVRATDPAYVMFTSGSTGPPKAVAVPHRGTVRLVAGADYVDLRADDVFLATTAPAFDVSCFEIFGAHLTGAHLVLPEPEALLSPAALRQEIRRSGATVMWLTAGLFHRMGFACPDMFAPLRYVIAGGDTLNPECMRAILDAGPPGHLMSGYGPCENATFSTTRLITALPPIAQTVPIGRPIANSTCYVLREDRSPCEPEEEGELYVGGDGVALGYLGDQERTAERFVPDPFLRRRGALMYRTGDRGLWRSDGVLEFTGRMDRQVKIRGYRVELGEVETVAAAHPQVHDAKAVVDEADAEDRALVLWAAPRHPARDEEERRRFARVLRSFLADRLPRFMLPARLAVTPRLPLGRTGKVDAEAVKALAVRETPGGGATSGSPRGDTELVLARLWARALGVHGVRREDDFFALGGQSLQVVRLVPALRDALGLDRANDRSLVRLVLDTPVLHDLAARLDDLRSGRADLPPETPDLHAEAVLDPDLRVPASSPPVSAPRSVLLTGATGFVGAFLTRRFLDVTDVRLICPVRAEDPAEGLRRIAAALRRYGLPPGELTERVTALPADLSAPGLGLDEAATARLAREVDTIVHNGAHVNFRYPYSRLRQANVDSVRTLLRLAVTGDVKALHFVSSIDVTAGLGAEGVDRVPEDAPLGEPHLLDQGYAETKWVAEAMLRGAAERGLPVSVYRPSEITGTTDRGVQNTATMMCALIKTMLEDGLAPRVPLRLDLVPVDTAAAALVRLVTAEPPNGHTYHLVNSAPAPLSLLLERARALGYAVDSVPYTEWTAAIGKRATATPDMPIGDYLPLFTEKSSRTGMSVFEAHLAPHLPVPGRENFDRAMRGSGLVIPPVDGDLLDRQLHFLRRTGFLQPPRRIDHLDDQRPPIQEDH
ncbi:amino acid adenylation domain-containing protein [Actinomadura terrae]|uniref:amino acid adenylation domain-containing protein n=1 Tax=Actinomadura terrae TaxID=604353 RepID=UPI0023431C98|nr:amino acid adenylation domain-containing protein [Actinomadura terrae]